MEGGNPLLQFEPGLMIWTIGVFLLMFAALHRVAWRPLLASLDAREQRIKNALAQAEKTQKLSADAALETERRIAEAVTEAQQIVQTAREDGERRRDSIVGEAKDEAKRLVEQGMRRIEAEQRTAMQQIREEAVDLAIKAAGRLVQTTLSEDQQRQIVQQFLEQLPDKRVN